SCRVCVDARRSRLLSDLLRGLSGESTRPGGYDLGVTRDFVVIAFLVGLLVVAPLGAASPYFLITPGGTYDIGSRVRVPDEQRRPLGRLPLTAAHAQEADLGRAARAHLVRRAA